MEEVFDKKYKKCMYIQLHNQNEVGVHRLHVLPFVSREKTLVSVSANGRLAFGVAPR